MSARSRPGWESRESIGGIVPAAIQAIAPATRAVAELETIAQRASGVENAPAAAAADRCQPLAISATLIAPRRLTPTPGSCRRENSTPAHRRILQIRTRHLPRWKFRASTVTGILSREF